MDSLTFLGTGDSMGVPRVYCSCGVCMESRDTGSNLRLRSVVMISVDGVDGVDGVDAVEAAEAADVNGTTAAINAELLIDCGPDWTKQMEYLQKRELEHVLITHAHHDHVAGLPEWGDACRWTGEKGNVYAPADVLGELRKRYPWLESNLNYHDISFGFEFKGWFIRPWKVFHGKNGYSYAYYFAKDGYCWAYCSDAISLTEEQKIPLFGLDLLILGTSFYQEEAELHTRSVYDVVEALELIAEIKPKQVFFTHLSHGIDIMRNYGLPFHVNLAKLGMKFNLVK